MQKAIFDWCVAFDSDVVVAGGRVCVQVCVRFMDGKVEPGSATWNKSC